LEEPDDVCEGLSEAIDNQNEEVINYLISISEDTSWYE